MATQPKEPIRLLSQLDMIENYVREARKLIETTDLVLGSSEELAARQLTFAVQALVSIRRLAVSK